MENIMWCIVYSAPMRTIPLTGAQIIALPMYAKVEKINEIFADYQGQPAKFYEVIYHSSPEIAKQGWVYAGYLEDYHEEFATGSIKILNATPNPNDAAQYVMWMGNVQYNLCGHLSVSYCAGWDADINDFLNLLKEKKLSFVSRVFPSWRSRGTNTADLDIMLSLFDYTLPSQTIGAALLDRVAGRILVTPGRMANILKDNRVIYSVQIDAQTGYLKNSGVLHWVVLEEVIPDEFKGTVKLYNPFTNKLERYEWNQLMASGGTPYGIVVPR
ncbi:MAG: hypothetical protein NTW69_17435 [Chloroflexi bacterium]|nr:hypothetical protein [Chloroflexota bacterium]